MDGGNVPNNQYVTVGNAATVTGISERTLRYWIKSGKRGCLVRLADVEALASLTGNERQRWQCGSLCRNDCQQ